MSSEALAHVRRMLEAEPFAVRRYARTQLLEGMRALLAEVARLEQRTKEVGEEAWKARADRSVAEAALAVSHKREQRSVRLLTDAMYQLQIADPVRWRLLRQNQAASGVDEPAAATKDEVGAVCDAFIDWMDSVGYNSIEAAEIVASCRAAATLAEPGGIGGSGATGATTAAGRRVATPGLKTDASSPGSASAAADEPASAPACICGAAHGSWHSPECSAHLKAAYDAAADEPAHKRPASSDGMGRTPPGGRATQDPEIGATPAAADESGETQREQARVDFLKGWGRRGGVSPSGKEQP